MLIPHLYSIGFAMEKNKLFLRLLGFYFLFTMAFVHATSTPLFTLEPITPTSIPVPSNGTAVVQYTVTNMSSKPHTLKMVPITGMAQVTNVGNCADSFALTSKQSCTLTLQVNGAQMSPHYKGGPIVCQQGPNGKPNPNQCYQPSAANVLNVTVATPSVPTLYVGTQNGVYYSIDDGTTWVGTNPPAGGSAISSVVALSTILYAGSINGTVYSSFNNGTTWSPIVSPAPGYAVNALYVSANYKLYIASANGSIFICSLNGKNCTTTTPPATGFAVNAIFVATNALYAASANGLVYYSNNNGVTWVAINGQPDGSAVSSVYVAANTLYVGTANEYVYTSTSLTGGGAWTPYAQTVYSLFVNAAGSVVYAGTQGGFIYSLISGNEVGFVTYGPINSLYQLG